MRWDGLFADLEAQAAAMAGAELGAEVQDRTRLENSRLSLQDRLRPAVGSRIRLRCLAGVTLTGRLCRVSPEWLLLDEGAGREAVVACAAIGSVAGLGRAAAAPDSAPLIESRLGLGHVLRGVARDRSVLRLQLADSSVMDGTLDRVGADFVELALHAAGELRRRGEVREVLAIPFGAIVAVRRDG